MLQRLGFGGVALITALLLSPGCGWIFRCGCRTLWGGAAALCNVNQIGAPHCPWCEWPLLGGLAAGLTLGLQWLVFRSLSRHRGVVLATLGALAALLPAMVVAGMATWLVTDYPHLLAAGARATLGLPAGPLHCGGS